MAATTPASICGVSKIGDDIVAELRPFPVYPVVWRNVLDGHQLRQVKATPVDVVNIESPRRETGPAILSMSALGRLGRFGNQIFQYAFLRISANASNAMVQCAPWIGQSLFGHDDPPVTVALTPLVEKGSDTEGLLEIVPEFMPYLEKTSGKKPQRTGVEAMSDGSESGDLIGFFQWHTSAYLPHRDFFRSLFQPVEDMRDWIDEPLTMLRHRGKTIVAIHLRSGDYKWLPQFNWTLMVPPQWWVEWLDSVWNKLDEPVLYLCSNDVATVRHWFGKYNPITSDDLRLQPPYRLRNADASFYRDFHVMTQADVLGISNSTFSFAAAMLNERARMFVRPHWDFETRFRTFDPWNAEPLLSLPGGRRKTLKNYGAMLRVALKLKGIRGLLSDALVYHPSAAAMLVGTRLRLAYEGRGLRGVLDFLLGRGP